MKPNFILFILLIGCNQPDMKHYSYADGNGNLFKISTTEIHYIPITQETSSSGIYSGGLEKKVAIPTSQYHEIATLFEEAAKNKSAHTSKRKMMTGLVMINTRKEQKSIILRPSSDEKKQIESVLHTIVQPQSGE